VDEYVDGGKVFCAVDIKLYLVNCSLISNETAAYVLCRPISTHAPCTRRRYQGALTLVFVAFSNCFSNNSSPRVKINSSK
jgi:hypothetical protein